MVILFILLGSIVSYIFVGMFMLNGGLSEALTAVTVVLCGSIWGSDAWVVKTIKESNIVNNK